MGRVGLGPSATAVLSAAVRREAAQFAPVQPQLVASALPAPGRTLNLRAADTAAE